MIYAAPHAIEAGGTNAIPGALSNYLASATGAPVDADLVQTNRTLHTGAKTMEQLLTRSTFDGHVQPGGKYVLVDDVTTLGGTLADFANYIRPRAVRL